MNMKSRATLIKVLNAMFVAFLVLYILVNVFNHGIFTSRIITSIILLFAARQSMSKNIKLDSTKALGKYIEENWSNEFWYKDKDIEAETLSGNYYFIITITKLSVFLCIFIFGNSMFNNLNYNFDSNIKKFLVIMIIVFIIQTIIYFTLYFKICRLITQRCDPYLCVITFYKIISIERGKEFRVISLVKLFVANSMVYSGDFYFPIEYLNLIYKENPRKINEILRCEMNYIKFFCLFASERYDDADKVKDAFEDKVNKNKRLKKNRQVKQFLFSMEKCYWLLYKKYTSVCDDAENTLKKAKAEIIKVNCNYRLYRAHEGLGNIEAAQKCKDYVLAHGNTTYYVTKCRENRY